MIGNAWCIACKDNADKVRELEKRLAEARGLLEEVYDAYCEETPSSLFAWVEWALKVDKALKGPQ